MGWELFTDWTDLQFVNYSESEQFEDGTIAAWRLEDWEIYGPGAGGYSSSGPYGDWQSDILSWLNNGSMLAYEIIDWDLSQLQSHNLSQYTQQSARTGALTTFYLNGVSYLPQDTSPNFGPIGSDAEYTVGDIVVTGTRLHADQSRSFHFATYDPYTNQPVSWVENATFLDLARANGDANIMRFDLAEGEAPLSEPEVAAVGIIRSGVQDIIADLQRLGPGGYFEVEGWGRIPVSELISLLTLSDWTIHPQTRWHPVPPPEGQPTVLGTVERNFGNPELLLNRSQLLLLAHTPSLLYWHILHEIAHATRRGWENRFDSNREGRTNDVAAAILERIGRPIHPYESAGTAIEYRAGVPVT